MSRATRGMKLGATSGLALVLATCAASMTDVRKFEGERNIPELIRAVTDVSSPEAVRDAAGFALRRIGEPAVEPLIRHLTDSDFYVRGMAAEVLGSLGDRRASRPLAAALAKEPNGYTALMLGQSIERICDPSAVPVLRQMSGSLVPSTLATIEQSQRCRADPGCKSEGKCTAMSDTPSASCEPRSDTDCRWSEACAKEKRCYLFVTGGRCATDICEGASGKYSGCP